MPHNPPYGREVRIRIDGPAGFGIKAAGQSLARMFARAGFHTFDLTEYPSLIKGGHNTYHLRVSADPIASHVMPTDILVALDSETIALHRAELSDGAAIIFDPDAVDTASVADADALCLVPVPLASLVREVGGQPIMRNIASLGAVLGHLDYPLDGLVESIRSQFVRKAPEIAEQNIAVATAGYNHAREAHCHFPFALPNVTNPAPFVLADGNEAAAIGALAAGIGFYAAYPMTPATSVLHYLAAHAESEGVVVKHAEDEIAAINMVIGAAFGGTRAMCATSGGGFSLMVEALGFAGVSESAIVVFVSSRPGPATGLPTYTEQSDLRFLIHAAQGEFPRLVLAPGDHAEAFELTWQAFNLADQLQTPVLLLGDAYLSDNRATSAPYDTTAVTIDRGRLVTENDVASRSGALGQGGAYARYADAPDGVSTRVLPGIPGATQLVNSYEHDEHGFGAPAEVAAVRTQQNEKRLRKLDTARGLVPLPRRYGGSAAAVSIVLFGSTKMPAVEAMRWLAAESVEVEILQLVTLWPFPAEEVAAFLAQAHTSLVIEGNATGQLEGLIAEQCLARPGHHLRRSDGRPFSPEMIYAKVHEIIGRPVSLDSAGALSPTEEVS